MTNLEGRLIKLELLVKDQAQTIRALNTRANAMEQQGRQPLAMMWQGAGGGGDVRAYWCRTPGAVAAATGTWPTLTATPFTADVYKDVAGTMTLEATGATVRWWYKDTAVVNKLVPCLPNGDGTYDALADSCTAV